MDIEKQVVSLELAKKLKDARYPQGKSEFMWVDYGVGNPRRDQHEYRLFHRKEFDEFIHNAGMVPYFVVNKIDAPLSCELGEKLPACYGSCVLNIEKYSSCWGVLWYDTHDKKNTHKIKAYTEADAMAKMWLHLKDKGLL